VLTPPEFENASTRTLKDGRAGALLESQSCDAHEWEVNMIPTARSNGMGKIDALRWSISAFILASSTACSSEDSAKPDVAGDYGAAGPYEVVVEENLGEAFRNDVADDTQRFTSFISAIDPNSPVAAELTTYPADLDRQLYTLFRPARLEAGKRYPVITWGNGTCAQPRLYVELLKHLASHGFIVIATNWRWVAGGVEMQRGLDFVLAENDAADSPLFGHVDTAMLGASGHSQGSAAAVTVGADPRVVATVPIQGAGAAGVAALQGPTFLIAGELDTLVAPDTVNAAFQAATVPAVYGISIGQDHLMPGRDPTPILSGVTAWFRTHLAADDGARAMFYGDACGLCSDSAWQIERRNL
jgi:pimeloyl-ACP methyl ester carboxylesterase